MPQYILGHRAKARSKMIRYLLGIGSLLVVIAVLQVSLFSRFRLFHTVPDLMLGIVLCVAFFCGRYAGAINGIAAGFLIEAIGAHGITVLPLFYLLCGYLVGHYARGVMTRRYPTYLSYVAIAVVARAGVTLFYISMNYSDINIPKHLVEILLPEAAYTAAMACLLYFPVGLLCRLLEKEDRRAGKKRFSL